MVRTGRRLILIVNIYFFDRGCLCDLCALIFEINVRYYSQNMITQIMFTHGKHAEKRQNDMVPIAQSKSNSLITQCSVMRLYLSMDPKNKQIYIFLCSFLTSYPKRNPAIQEFEIRSTPIISMHLSSSLLSYVLQ